MDVLLFQTNDGGDMEIEGGLVTLSPGLSTATYLSLFGGNQQDDGSQDNALTWWGNLGEIDTAKRYRSETQYLLGTIPATSGNLKRIEDAALRDLEWMVKEEVCDSIDISASLIGVNCVKIDVNILAEGDETQFEYTQDWRAGD